ncbi:MAG: hypothetical protein O2973_08155 [Gemmatimonadetes bacterium]|nr:hypothetical protein [Gemmatimonadota bacterium]
MRRTGRSIRSRLSALVSLGIVFGFAACDVAGLTDGDSGGISSADAAVIAKQFAEGMSNGVSNLQPGLAASALRENGPGRVSNLLVNVPISQRTNCTAGGNINVSGSMTGSISDEGTGALLLGMTETITDWACVGGYVFNGDPYLSAAGTFSFLSGVLSSPASISMGGAIKWTGNGGGSCTMQLTTLVYSNGTGRTSGHVCGQSVDVSLLGLVRRVSDE